MEFPVRRSHFVLASMTLAVAMMAGCASQGSAPEEKISAAKPATVGADGLTDAQRDLGRQSLSFRDGWASFKRLTAGGALAEPDHVFVVSSREQLVTALGGDNASNGDNTGNAIIYVKGTVDLLADKNGKALGAKDFADPAYDWDAYLKAYSPEAFGHKAKAKGPLEDARKRSQKNQEKYSVINVGSNKTIVGVGADARIIGGGLKLNGSSNVIIRNIGFEDAYDLFPEWDPRDGKTGNWNSEYDNIQIINGARYIWIDHCSFADGKHPDTAEPKIFGRYVQHHDGAIDITNQSDLVTVSYNVFRDHDKMDLIGSSDKRKDDAGKLRVSFHHNLWENTTQRMPRVRYGQVDVFNNYYRNPKYKDDDTRADYQWLYGIGIGFASKVYSENNFFELGADVPAGTLIANYKGESFFDKGSMLNGKPVDMLKEYNAFAAAHPEKKLKELKSGVDWSPVNKKAKLNIRPDGVLPAADVPAYVLKHAGVGKL